MKRQLIPEGSIVIRHGTNVTVTFDDVFIAENFREVMEKFVGREFEINFEKDAVPKLD